jgi:hypothetical protein
MVGAKRIEWSFKDRDNFVWKAANNVLDPGITCEITNSFNRCQANEQTGGIEPQPPALKAPVRAGANVTFQWTDIVRHHDGPAISVSTNLYYSIVLHTKTNPSSTLEHGQAQT